MAAILGFIILIFVLAAVTNRLAVAASTWTGRIGFLFVFVGCNAFGKIPQMDGWTNNAIGLCLTCMFVCFPLGLFLICTAKKASAL